MGGGSGKCCELEKDKNAEQLDRNGELYEDGEEEELLTCSEDEEEEKPDANDGRRKLFQAARPYKDRLLPELRDEDEQAFEAREASKRAAEEQTVEGAFIKPDPRPDGAPSKPSVSFAPAAPESKRTEDGGSDIDDEEFMRLSESMKAMRQGRAVAVAAECMAPDEGFTPPVHEKTIYQRSRIEKAMEKSFMFADLQQQELNVVIEAFREHKVSPGDVVIKQGAEVLADEPGLYVVELGRYDVHKSNDPNVRPGEKVHEYDSAGQTFGELALLYNAPRAATVIARTEGTLWSIDRSTFNFCVKDAARRRRERYGEFLASVEILQPLTEAERWEVVDAMKLVTFRRGDRVIRTGDVGEEMFLIEAGTCEARSDGEVLKTYGPREYFGELALLYTEPRAADIVVTSQEARLVTVGRQAFDSLLGPLEQLMKDRAAAYGAAAYGPGSPRVHRKNLQARAKRSARSASKEKPSPMSTEAKSTGGTVITVNINTLPRHGSPANPPPLQGGLPRHPQPTPTTPSGTPGPTVLKSKAGLQLMAKPSWAKPEEELAAVAAEAPPTSPAAAELEPQLRAAWEPWPNAPPKRAAPS